tara:strand:+ start:2173 stop:2364 length:192 start_codon:yes stop_codon:yes gene_type:complete
MKAFRSEFFDGFNVWTMNLTAQVHLKLVYGKDSELMELEYIIEDLEEELRNEKDKKIPFKLRE